MSRIRSIEISGRKLSISLEDSFWFSLQAIARMENMKLEAFVEAVEASGPSFDLSSNLRVAILEYFQAQLADNIAMAGTDERRAEPRGTPERRSEPRDKAYPTFWQRLVNPKEKLFH
jgi:predicted DNA-binding ribbon-helix-helix protein